MGYQKIRAIDAPKRERQSISRFEKTEEWRLMKRDLDRGLKPEEALELILTDEDREKYDLQHRRTVARFLRKYLRSHNMPYRLKSFSRETGDYFLVMHVSKRKV